jgi:hypothetical protein
MRVLSDQFKPERRVVYSGLEPCPGRLKRIARRQRHTPRRPADLGSHRRLEHGSLSRRAALLLFPLAGLAGCSEWQAAQDPYIPAMKKDPMFSWRPPGNLRREINYSPSQVGLEPSDQSQISILHWLPKPGDVSKLVSSARQAMDDAGYSASSRHIDPKYDVVCMIGGLPDRGCLVVTLVAPYWR